MKTFASIRFKQAFGFLAAGLMLLPAACGIAKGSAQSLLVATTGHGAGLAIVVPTTQNPGGFAAEISVYVQNTAPNTTFSIERAPDLVADGICTGPIIPFGESLTTNSSGAGSKHFHFERGAPFVTGVKFDVAFRVVGSDGTILQGNCMQVTVK